MGPFSNRNLITPTRKELPAILLCWLAFLLSPYLLAVLPRFQSMESMEDLFLYNIAVDGICFILILLCFKNFLFRSLMPGKVFLISCFWAFLASYGINSLLSYFLALIQFFLPEAPENMNQNTVESMMQVKRLPMLFMVSVLAPVIEEILFRASIFGPLCKKRPFLAYVVTMCAFSFIHVYSYIGEVSLLSALFSFAQYLPAGLALCWCYQYYGSIWVPIVVHGLMNLVASMAL